jgi:hypothetical protein
MTTASPVAASWQEQLEQQIRALPGVKFSEVTTHGSKIFRAGPYRLIVPNRSDRATRLGALRDFEVLSRRYLHWREREFGSRPADVAQMRPQEPEPAQLDPGAAAHHQPPSAPALALEPGPVASAATQVIETLQAFVATGQQAQRAVDEALARAAEQEIKTETPKEAAPMPEKKQRAKAQFAPCPVPGCKGFAQGRHLSAHKKRGELPPDYKLRSKKPPRSKRGEAAAEHRPRATTGAAVKHYVAAMHEAGKEVGRAIAVLQQQLTEMFNGPLKAFADFADTLHVENTDLRRQMALMRMNIQKAGAVSAALAALANDEKSVVARLRG